MLPSQIFTAQTFSALPLRRDRLGDRSKRIRLHRRRVRL